MTGSTVDYPREPSTETIDILNRARARGAAARMAGKPITENPHAMIALAQAWAQGWLAAKGPCE